MKFFLNALLAVIVLAWVFFGLNKFGIITLSNTSDSSMDSELSWEIVGNLNDSIDIEDELNQVEEWKEEESKPTTPTVIYANYPYNGDKALVGEFTTYGNTEDGKWVLLYKVKLWGNIGGVANKWISYTSWNSISWTVKFVDANGNEITRDETLAANQVVYVEVLGYKVPDMMTNDGKTWTTTSSVTSSNNTKYAEVKPNPLSKSCVAYQEFFNCIISKVSGIDPDIMKNQLYAFFGSMSSLSASEQDAKCTNLIYEIKSKSASESQAVCLELLK